MTQPFLISDRVWMPIRDGNPSALAIFRRHYSCKNRRPKLEQFIGPGEKMALLSADALALFAWRKERFRFDGQRGCECTVFRNEGAGLSSDLIREADRIAWERWPGARHFTFVDASKVASRNPGYCFLMAGWRKCGVTKTGLLIFERLP